MVCIKVKYSVLELLDQLRNVKYSYPDSDHAKRVIDNVIEHLAQEHKQQIDEQTMEHHVTYFTGLKDE